ncbi:hypothetical protein DBV39_01990 [Orrella marina]|uniref:Uncharacterized protein n=1 Tax=Orrella marina TaxID=2163011 RepID=A0A2R4XFV8_9BURK|nr:hypothetical protein DBV39_01990 [Orrella marina]
MAANLMASIPQAVGGMSPSGAFSVGAGPLPLLKSTGWEASHGTGTDLQTCHWARYSPGADHGLCLDRTHQWLGSYRTTAIWRLQERQASAGAMGGVAHARGFAGLVCPARFIA